MELVYLISALIVAGALVGWLAGPIWKNRRPYGLTADYAAAIATTVIVGLIDYFVIPAMDFSDTIKWIGVAIEPVLGAFFVLWIMRKARP